MRAAVYCRVSSASQTERSQRAEVERWLLANGLADATWYVDTESGNHLDRAAFKRLQAAVFDADVDVIIVYKLDRISRSLVDGINTLVGWCKAGVRVVATSQQLDFSGPAGQLVAAVLFAVAQMETEARRERQRAGILAARAKNVKWGGSRKGRRLSVHEEQIELARRLRSEGQPVAQIAKATKISRRHLCRLLGHDAAAAG
jgi:DNA invertase Pin-like site-specific DNA recombinase